MTQFTCYFMRLVISIIHPSLSAPVTRDKSKTQNPHMHTSISFATYNDGYKECRKLGLYRLFCN